MESKIKQELVYIKVEPHLERACEDNVSEDRCDEVSSNRQEVYNPITIKKERTTKCEVDEPDSANIDVINKSKLEAETSHKVFTQKASLNAPMRTNTGGKLFKCGICNETRSTMGSLAEHMRIHMGDKPYECRICDKKYRTKDRLTVHLRTHARGKLRKCDICHKIYRHYDGRTKPNRLQREP